MNDMILGIIEERLLVELESIQYFNTEADPAWLFESLDRLHTQLVTGVYAEIQNPCVEMAGQVWILTCRGRYQEASRKHVISILFSLNNEIKKLSPAYVGDCGAV